MSWHHTHPAFTNKLSEDVVQKSDIFLFNFDLRSDGRLPKDVADAAILKYRTMKIPAITEKGPVTYEDKDAEGDVNMNSID